MERGDPHLVPATVYSNTPYCLGHLCHATAYQRQSPGRDAGKARCGDRASDHTSRRKGARKYGQGKDHDCPHSCPVNPCDRQAVRAALHHAKCYQVFVDAIAEPRNKVGRFLLWKCTQLLSSCDVAQICFEAKVPNV